MSSSAALELHLDDAQRALCRDTHRLAVDVLKPLADAEPSGRVNRPLIVALAEHGLLARLFGRGSEDRVSAIDLCLIREALARACTAAETAFALQGLGAYPLAQVGGPEIRAAWIPRVAAGTARSCEEIGAIAAVAKRRVKNEKSGFVAIEFDSDQPG